MRTATAVAPRSSVSRRVDGLFRAFSDLTRLRILNLLRDGELCVCDLVEVLQLPQPTVSRHLSYLRRAGLIRAREERSWNFYSLSVGRTEVHKKLLECLTACTSEMPKLANDGKRASDLRARGGCCPS